MSAFDQVLFDLLEVNPQADPESIVSGVHLDQNGTVQDWHLSGCNLSLLPESFAHLHVSRLLDLSDNFLQVLPGILWTNT